MVDETLDPQIFIDGYGPDAPVIVGSDMRITLGQALAAEAFLCPADAATRENPERRVQYVAGILAAAGTLRPEDAHLLGGTE